MPRTLLVTITLALAAAGLRAGEPFRPPQVGMPKEALTQEQGQRIVEARRAVRADFFDAGNHARLALAYHEVGADIMAFRLLRFAETRYFTPAEFRRAFQDVFHGEVDERSLLPADEARAAAAADTRERPEDAEAWRELGRRLSAAEDHAGAIAALERACALAPEDGACAAALAGAIARGGDGATAREQLRAFLVDHPASVPARVQLADLLQRESDDLYMAATQSAAAGVDQEPAVAAADSPRMKASRLAAMRARRVLRDGLAQAPDAARLHLAMAYLLSRADEPDAAAHHYSLAAKLEPDNPVMLAWHGRSLLVDQRDKDAALEVYLKAWFLEPNTRETSPIHERLGSLIEDSAAVVLATVQGEREALLQFDSWNAQVAMGSWALAAQKPGFSQVLIDIAFSHLAHDDEAVRFQAARYLGERAPKEADTRLAGLIDHEDVFVRGLGLYIGITRWGRDVKDDLVHAMASDNDYLRYEAYSAILQLGEDWGRRLFDAHFPAETNPYLKRLIKPR